EPKLLNQALSMAEHQGDSGLANQFRLVPVKPEFAELGDFLRLEILELEASVPNVDLDRVLRQPQGLNLDPDLVYNGDSLSHLPFILWLGARAKRMTDPRSLGPLLP